MFTLFHSCFTISIARLFVITFFNGPQISQNQADVTCWSCFVPQVPMYLEALMCHAWMQSFVAWQWGQGSGHLRSCEDFISAEVITAFTPRNPTSKDLYVHDRCGVIFPRILGQEVVILLPFLRMMRRLFTSKMIGKKRTDLDMWNAFPMVFRNSEVSQERKAEMMREAARLEMDCTPTDLWQYVFFRSVCKRWRFVNTLVTVNFNSDFWDGSDPPKKSRQGSHCFAGLPGVPSSEHGCSGAQALRRLQPLLFHFCRVTSLNISYATFVCKQGKQNWRLSSKFFFAKCGTRPISLVLHGRLFWVPCLHLKPFHIARWMLTTAWPSCKSMSLGWDWKLLFKQGNRLLVRLWNMMNYDELR